MSTRMQQRRGTANQWISTNQGNGPILSPGEIGFESDTNKFKIGDGINHWVDLTYFTDAESITTALNSIIDGAPAALNTLNELAAALGDDANFLSSLATESYVDTAVGNIDLSTKQDVVSGVSSTEIGYLDGVTSAIQTQLNAKLEASDIADLATETYVDTAVGNVTVDLSVAAGTGLDWTGTQFEVDTATVFANPTISSGLTLDGTGDFTVSADENIILDATTEVYIGSAATGNEVATKSYADAAAAATQTALDAKLASVVTINAQTANYTLVLGDKDKMVEMNVGSANTLTVPANSSVAYPIGTKINIVQTGSGQTTLTAGGGVTINGTPGLKTRAQWSAVTLVKRATDTWVAFGDLTA